MFLQLGGHNLLEINLNMFNLNMFNLNINIFNLNMSSNKLPVHNTLSNGKRFPEFFDIQYTDDTGVYRLKTIYHPGNTYRELDVVFGLFFG